MKMEKWNCKCEWMNEKYKKGKIKRLRFNSSGNVWNNCLTVII